MANEANQSAAAAGGTPSIISGDLKIIGNLQSNGDLQIDGQIEGDIHSRTLTIGENAKIKGTVTGDTVRICGALKGKVSAKSVILTRTAKVVGDIAQESLAIESGAMIEGRVTRLGSEAARQAAAASQPGASPTAPASPNIPPGAAKAAETPKQGVGG